MGTRSVTGTQVKDPNNADVLLIKYYQFTVSAAGTVTITAGNRGATTGSQDSLIYVFDANGNLVGRADDGGGGPRGHDSLLALNLQLGSYVIAISEINYSEADARSGRNPGESGEEATIPFFINVAEGTAVVSQLSEVADFRGTLLLNPPVAANDAATVAEDSANESASGNVLGNDTDPNGDPLSVSGFRAGTAADTNAGPGATVQGRYGTLTLNADGSYTYTADSDLLDTLPADAQDVFTYLVSDGQGGSDEATLTITIDERGDNRTTNGTSRHDTINGDQSPSGAGTEDTINAGTGNDTVNGLGGADTLYGGSGNDTLNGGDGRDKLFGESGTDAIDGGAGDDDINGGSGNDRMTGGDGADDFIFQNGNGYDTIVDFQVGTDRLVIEAITIRSLTEKDVNNDRIMDTIVTFGSGGGNVTLLGVSGLTEEELVEPAGPPAASSMFEGGMIMI